LVGPLGPAPQGAGVVE